MIAYFASLPLTIQTIDISTTEDTDYTTQDGVEVTVTLAGSPVNINIPILDNNDAECSETFQVTITGISAGALNTVSVTIEDDDPGFIDYVVADNQFVASSELQIREWNSYFYPYNGNYYGPYWYSGFFNGPMDITFIAGDANNINAPVGPNKYPPAWAPNFDTDTTPLIQVIFTEVVSVTGIAIQGSDMIWYNGLVPFVTPDCCFTPELQIIGELGGAYTAAVVNGNMMITGNNNKNDLVEITFDDPIIASSLILTLPPALCDGVGGVCALRFQVRGCPNA
ncbi:uncharacterized protein [Amphiura filiformis]|uniref:uncharacterized protein n=1 Tax=Amphiura filiformis TaxID=82378 RepID=UPI003B21AE00